MTFERYTERARQVVTLAQEEARTSRSAEIGILHLVGALLREEHGLAAQVLKSLGVPPPSYADVKKVPTGEVQTIAFSTAAKNALERALREALSLGCNYIGTEHILLGVLRREGQQPATGEARWLPYGMIAQDVREALDLALSGRSVLRHGCFEPEKSEVKPISVLHDLKEARDVLNRAISTLTGAS